MIDAQVEQGVSEVEKIIWEELNSALTLAIKALLMTAAAIYLPQVARRINAAESKVREQMDAKRQFRDVIVNTLFDPWLERFSPLFSQAGRPRKSDDQKQREARDKRKTLEMLRRNIDQIVEEWAAKKSRPKMTGRILCKELEKKGQKMGLRTLNRRLRDMDESVDSIKSRIEKSRAT